MKRIRISVVMDRVGFKRTKIYAMIKNGEFPPPKKDGCSSFWLESEIDKWIEQRHPESA